MEKQFYLIHWRDSNTQDQNGPEITGNEVVLSIL